MSTIVIVGAGALGGALAHKLASRDRVARIHLVDDNKAVASGKALDIQQAGPVEGFRTRVGGGSDLGVVIGATAIVLTGPVAHPDDDWTGDDGLTKLRQIAGLERRAPILCAGSSGRGLVERAVSELSLDRRRVIGTAPAALTAALRALIALELRCSPLDVQLTVSGIPPAQTVVGWGAATIGGRTLEESAGANVLARLRAMPPRVWPPGPYTLASAATRVVEAVAEGGSTKAFACFVALDGEWGVRGRAVAMPVLIGPFGVNRVLEPTLSAHERVQLHTTLQAGNVTSGGGE
jgi:malate dehydrogenase